MTPASITNEITNEITNDIHDLYAELSAQSGAQAIDDPYPLFAQRRRTMPVMEGDLIAEFGVPAQHQTIDGSRRMFTLFRYDDIVAALRDPETFSSGVINAVTEPILGRMILGLDGQEHRSQRGLMVPAFTRRIVEMWRTEIVRPLVREKVEQLARQGSKRADLFDFALEFPVQMVYRMLGLPNDQRGYDEFARSGLAMLIGVVGVNPNDPEQTRRARARAKTEAESLYGLIYEIVRARRAEGSDGDDFIGHLLRSEFEGARLDDDQITIFVRMLLPAAGETTSRQWLNVMVCLLERPDVLAEVTANRDLLPAAIDEAIRLEGISISVGRGTTRDVEVRGVTIPAGSGVTLMLGSANRDEDVFEDPDSFNIHRDGRTALTWGFGPHICIGMNTARMEMLEATSAVLDLLPDLRFDPAEDPPAIRGLKMRSATRLPVAWG